MNKKEYKGCSEKSLCCNAEVICVGDEYYEPERVECTKCHRLCRVTDRITKKGGSKSEKLK